MTRGFPRNRGIVVTGMNQIRSFASVARNWGVIETAAHSTDDLIHLHRNGFVFIYGTRTVHCTALINSNKLVLSHNPFWTKSL